MVMYQIESSEKRRNKKLIIFAVILAIIAIAIAIFAGIKTAEKIAKQKQLEQGKNDVEQLNVIGESTSQAEKISTEARSK